MKLLLFLIFLLGISLLPVAAEGSRLELTQDEEDWIAEKHIVRIPVFYWPPYQINADGLLTGISVDYIKAIFDRLGIRYELKSYDSVSWKKAMQDIREHKGVDLLLTAKPTALREKNMLFTDYYISSPWVIYTRNDTDNIHDFADLRGKKVSVEENFVITGLLKKNYPDIILLEARGIDTPYKALRAVATGEADAYIGNLATGCYIARALGLHDLKVVGDTPFGNDTNAMIVRKDWPELVSIINKSLHNFSEEFKSRVGDRYYSVRYEYGLSYIDITFWVALTSLILGGILIYVIIINKKLALEVYERKKVRYEMNEYLAIVDENVIVIIMNREMIITDASAAFCKVSKTNKLEIIGKKYSDICISNIAEDLHQVAYDTIRSEKVWSCEVEAIASDGSRFWVKNVISPKYAHDGVLLGYVSVGHDITAQKMVEKLSVTDSLTKIFNRFKLDEIMEYELEKSKRYKHTFSLIMVDLDDFKKVNDHFGHQTGDDVLRIIADILSTNTRTSDTVGRWGGDEFMLICPETKAAEAEITAEKIRNVVDKSYFPKIGHLTISAGVASYIAPDDTQESMLSRADLALYEAKGEGRNRVVANGSGDR